MEQKRPNREEPHKFSLCDRFRSFVYAGKGLKLLLREHNTWVHLFATFCVIVVGACCSLSTGEWAVLAVVIGGVWITEALNTAIERLCDHVTPERHPEIGRIKDVAAGAVLLAAITAVVTGLLVFIPRFIEIYNQLFA